jgi:hypothetical protein
MIIWYNKIMSAPVLEGALFTPESPTHPQTPLAIEATPSSTQPEVTEVHYLGVGEQPAGNILTATDLDDFDGAHLVLQSTHTNAERANISEEGPPIPEERTVHIPGERAAPRRSSPRYQKAVLESLIAALENTSARRSASAIKAKPAAAQAVEASKPVEAIEAQPEPKAITAETASSSELAMQKLFLVLALGMLIRARLEQEAARKAYLSHLFSELTETSV